MDYKEILFEPYILYKVCSCSGTLTHKYRSRVNKAYEIHVYPKRMKFAAFKTGRVLFKDNLLNLQSYVEQNQITS